MSMCPCRAPQRVEKRSSPVGSVRSYPCCGRTGPSSAERFQGQPEPSCPAWPWSPSPAVPTQQPFEVLSCGNQQSLAVDFGQPSEPEPAEPVPRLGFREQRLDPYPPLTQGFSIRLGVVVAPDAVQVLLSDAAFYLATLPTPRTCRLDHARIAGRCWRLVEANPFRTGYACGMTTPHLADRRSSRGRRHSGISLCRTGVTAGVHAALPRFW